MTSEQRRSLELALALCPDGSCIGGLSIPAGLQAAWDAATPAVKVSMIESLQTDPTGAGWAKKSTAGTVAATAAAALGGAAAASPYIALASLGVTLLQSAIPALVKAFNGQEVSVEDQAKAKEAINRLRLAASYLGDEWVPSGK